MPITSTGTGEQPVALFHHIRRLREQAIEILIKGETDKYRNNYEEDQLQVLVNEIRELGKRLETFQILGIYKILKRETNSDYEFGAPIVLHLIHDEARKLYNLLVNELTKTNTSWKGLDKNVYPKVLPLCSPPTPNESLDQVHNFGIQLQSIGWEMMNRSIVPYSELISTSTPIIENNNNNNRHSRELMLETNLDEMEPISFSINNNSDIITNEKVAQRHHLANNDETNRQHQVNAVRNERASRRPSVDVINTKVEQRDLIDTITNVNEAKGNEETLHLPSFIISTTEICRQDDVNTWTNRLRNIITDGNRIVDTSSVLMEQKTTDKNDLVEAISQMDDSTERAKVTSNVAQQSNLISEIDQADAVVMEQLRNMNNAEPKRDNMEKLANVLQELGSRFESLHQQTQHNNNNNEQQQVLASGENLAIVLLKTRKLYQLIGKKLKKHYKGSLHDLGVEMDTTSRQIFRVQVDQIGEKFKIFGREMKEGLSSSQYVKNNSNKLSPYYGFNELLTIIGSILFYLVDVGSDVYLALQYFYQLEFWYFGLTLTFVMIPIVFIPLLLVEYQWIKFTNRYLNINEKRSKFWIIFRSSSSLFRYLEALWYGRNILVTDRRIQKRVRKSDFNNSNKIINDDEDGKAGLVVADEFQNASSNATLMRYLECLAHSAPQLALQLYIMKVGSFDFRGEYYSTVLIRYVSITTSLIGLSWIPTSLYRTMRFNALLKSRRSDTLSDYATDKENSFWKGDLILLTANFLLIVSRVIAISQFVPLDYTWAIWIICIIHWIACSVWIYFEYSWRRASSKSLIFSALERVLASIVMGFVYIFNFFRFQIENNDEKNEGRHYLVSFNLKDTFINYKYFTVSFLENTILLVIYILNANGFSGHLFSILTGDYNIVARVNYWSWYHIFFAASQPITFIIGFNLLHIYPLCYPSRYREWLKSASRRDDESQSESSINGLNE